jgi:hypothetical protein
LMAVIFTINLLIFAILEWLTGFVNGYVVFLKGVGASGIFSPH